MNFREMVVKEMERAEERFVKKEAGGKETEKQSEPDWYCGG